MIGLVVTANGQDVIGHVGTCPWRYPALQKRLHRIIRGKTVILGRSAWNEFGGKPLPGCLNVVLTHHPLEVMRENAERGSTLKQTSLVSSPQEALSVAIGDVLVLGGVRTFRAMEPFCEFFDLSLVPDVLEQTDDIQTLESIGLRDRYVQTPAVPHEDDGRLQRCTLVRKSKGSP